MNRVKWGEFKIGDLFEKLNLKFKKKIFDKEKDVSKIKTNEFDLPLVNAKDGDNGIMYFGRSSDFEFAEMTIDIVNDGAISTGNVYPQPQRTGVLYNAYLIKPKFNISTGLLYFFSAAIKKSIKLKYGYENKASWNKVKMELIQLPIKNNNQIDFEFMKSFIAELEAERIAELEAYLTAAGLKDYELTPQEQKAIDNYQNIEFIDFKVTDIFTVKNTGNILSRDIIENSGNTPYLCASRENNSVSSYISYNSEYLENGNCIFIGGKTFVVTYQEYDFYSNDSHNLILYLNDENNRDKLTQLYLATCINKSLGHKYSWGDSISNKKIQNDRVALPVNNDQPDLSLMATLISAIQKLVIKDVVLFLERKTTAYKQVVQS